MHVSKKRAMLKSAVKKLGEINWEGGKCNFFPSSELMRELLPNLGWNLKGRKVRGIPRSLVIIGSKQYLGNRQYLLACKAGDNDPIQSEFMNYSAVPTSHNSLLYFLNQ